MTVDMRFQRSPEAVDDALVALRAERDEARSIARELLGMFVFHSNLGRRTGFVTNELLGRIAQRVKA